MTTTKKLVSLSFSIGDFLSRYPPQTYDLTYDFPSIPVIGKQNLSFQLIFQELDSDTAYIKMEQSLDNTNFDDIVDSMGNPVQLLLPIDQSSVTLNLANINTAYIRCKLFLKFTTNGSFTNYIYLSS